MSIRVGFTLAAIALLSGPASALTIAPNPIPLVGTGGLGGSIVAAVELVSTAVGIPTGGVLSFGSVSPGDTSLIFRASVDSSSAPVSFLAVGAASSFPLVPPGLPFSGAGVIPGPGADITLIEISVDPSVAVVGLGPGTVSDLFFVAYPTPPGLGDFVLAGADEIASGCGGACVQNAATVVPEPETLTLVALGLAILEARRRRQRARISARRQTPSFLRSEAMLPV